MPYHRMVSDYGSQQGGFGSILKGILGVGSSLIPGPVGGIVRTASRLITGSRSPAVTPTPVIRPTPTAVPSPRARFTGVSLGGRSGIRVGRETTTTQGLYAEGLPQTTVVGCGPDGLPPKGYRLNKTGYFLKSGEWVPPNSRYVRIRKRNTANGKALTKAISRCGGFDKMVKRNRKNLRSLAKI